jgi:DNA-binding transcriptional ArsR family regulator
MPASELPATSPVGTLQQVLAALADPVRLEMVHRMASAAAPVACSLLYDGVNKSTASHHFKILREAGLTRTEPDGMRCRITLRRVEVEHRFPGMLDAILQHAGK